jgi:hypothetical protein
MPKATSAFNIVDFPWSLFANGTTNSRRVILIVSSYMKKDVNKHNQTFSVNCLGGPQVQFPSRPAFPPVVRSWPAWRRDKDMHDFAFALLLGYPSVRIS